MFGFGKKAPQPGGIGPGVDDGSAKPLVHAPSKPPAVLIDIQRAGRVNVFTFQRGNEIYSIETYGTMEDNLAEWKMKLLD